MKRWIIDKAFGLDNLRLVDVDEPKPGPGQALVRMKAMSLNFRDLMMVGGLYNPKQKLPLAPLSDGVGEVVEVGEGVTRVKPGDRVCTSFFQRWLKGEPSASELRSTLGGPNDGTLREYAVFSEEGLVHAPEHLTDEEAATLTCAAVTAWNAMVTYGSVKAGDVVLTLGSGGVSTFAIKFARMLGARVISTTGKSDKAERLRELGASAVINYKEDAQWGKTARELAGGDGVDLVVEVGGSTLVQSLAALRFRGQVSLIGVVAGPNTELNTRLIFMRGIKVQGIFVGCRDSFEAMNRAIALHKLKPVIDRVFPFEDAPEAMRYMRSGSHVGKVCIRVD